PGFKLQHFAVTILKQRRLRVWGFLSALLWIDTINTTRRINGNRMFVFIETPPRNVKLVWPLVAGITVSAIPEPVPVVMAPLLVVRTISRRSQPLVVM